jgi:mannose-6-phosphate isomerase-like protein (cupin superfamily)
MKFLLLVPLFFVLLMMAATVETSAGDVPILTKNKFETPVNYDKVFEEWKIRGYSTWENTSKEKGWSSTRSFDHNCVRIVLDGRLEYIIEGKSFIVEPGDELIYPANATQTATNLYDGVSRVLVGTQ